MKTLPIIALGQFEKQNAMLREYMRLNQLKTNKLLIIKTPEKKPDITNLLVEKDNIDFSEKIKKISEEILENFPKRKDIDGTTKYNCKSDKT